jgi:hypothetical protein
LKFSIFLLNASVSRARRLQCVRTVKFARSIPTAKGQICLPLGGFPLSHLHASESSLRVGELYLLPLVVFPSFSSRWKYPNKDVFVIQELKLGHHQ